MGPLVTQGIIDPAWNNLIALLVGMAFGFVLESSGFSSSRKLAGVFYGYDFVVLKVFFTAAITAALGLLIMSSIGMIDLSKIFINPTFLGPGIVGGIIMGFGFIMGGYCPGTSFCGAAIGKIDAIVFTLGMFVGILIFSELFPLYSDFFTSGAMGDALVTDVLGIPAGLFVLLLSVVAVGAFYVTGIIEKRVNNPKS
jgi:uncharacterized membrane protein YedE/YeeE